MVNPTQHNKVSKSQRERINALAPEANAILQSIEDRMLALSEAAQTRWRPELSLYDVNEDAPPVMGDEEYADVLAAIEALAERALTRNIAIFLGIPQEVIDPIIGESIRAEYLPGGVGKGKKDNSPFFVVKRGAPPGGPVAPPTRE